MRIKRQLNALCVLMFLCLGLSVLPNIFVVCNAFVDGFRYGVSQTRDAEKQGTLDSFEIKSPMGLSLWPRNLTVCQDSLLNLKTNNLIPAQHTQSIIWMEGEKSLLPTWLNGLLSIIGLVTVLWAVVLFYRLINAINHEVIFEWINVRRLNRIGIALLISFFMLQISWFFNYLSVKQLIELEGYDISFWGEFKTVHLILALVSLLVGRIFAMGITLREEQELTI